MQQPYFIIALFVLMWVTKGKLCSNKNGRRDANNQTTKNERMVFACSKDDRVYCGCTISGYFYPSFSPLFPISLRKTMMIQLIGAPRKLDHQYLCLRLEPLTHYYAYKINCEDKLEFFTTMMKMDFHSPAALYTGVDFHVNVICFSYWNQG